MLHTFQNYFYSYLKESFILELLFFLLIFFLLFFIRSIIAKIFIFLSNLILGKIFKLSDQQYFNKFADPFKIIPFYFLSLVFPFSNNYFALLIHKINVSLLSIFVFTLLYLILIPLINKLKYLNTLGASALYWIKSFIKFLLIFLCITSILEVWGIKVGPIIAGLGLLGVAVALGAQDLFKNLISGIMILLENRFNVGDVIDIPNHTDGTVEHIGFRSTLIRKFDSTPMSIPNYIFAEAPILNFSKRTNRRINWTIGLQYNSTLDQIKNLTDYIFSYLSNNNNFIVSDDFKAIVRIDKFNDSSIDILIYCFTVTTDWDKYLEIKESLAIEVKNKVEELKLNFAFPSQTIYLEKN